MFKRLLILASAILLFITQPAVARYDQAHMILNDSSGVAITDYSLTSGSAIYSEIINIERSAGFAAILITEDQSGGTGDVDISAEYSLDGTNWYPAYTSDMAGTITIEGNIVTALQNVTRWVVITQRISKYMRFKFDPDANSEITATYITVVDK